MQAIILSSRLKEMLMNVNSHDTFQGMYKPIKLVYRPSEPFFIVRQVISMVQSLIHYLNWKGDDKHTE